MKYWIDKRDKSVVLKTDNSNITDVARKVIRQTGQHNLIIIASKAELDDLSLRALTKIHNNLSDSHVNKFGDREEAIETVWGDLCEMDINDSEETTNRWKTGRNRSMLGKKIRLIPGWETKIWQHESRRKQCFDVIVALSNRGEKDVEIEDYLQACEEKYGFYRQTATSAMRQMEMKSQRHPVIDFVT